MLTVDHARAYVRDDPARACLAALVLANVALVWSLPLIVGQDLPQHLTYARILADYADPRLPFRDTFVLPEHPQPYFTAYLFLAPLTRLTSVLTACRVLYTVYVVAMATGFTSLVRAVHARAVDVDAPAKTPWTALFGALLAWNPVQCVGFLPFMLSLPAVLFGAAFVIRTTETGKRSDYAALVLACAAAASLHLVAGACLVLFAAFYTAARLKRHGLVVLGATAGATCLTVAAWHTLGERGLAELPTRALVLSIKSMGLFDGVVRTLGVQWTSFETKWAFVVATVLGPLTHGAKTVVAVLIVALVLVVVTLRKERAPRDPRTRARLAFGLSVVAFTLLVVATPAAIRLPDDICLLDFRLYVLAFMLALAWVDPRWFEPQGARVAITVFGALVLMIWSRQLEGVAGEANEVVRLVDRLEPTESVLALPFHDRSEYLDENNSVTHYFPMYYTALKGGLTSLFWGKFSHHLPVGYRAGHEPSRPPDWDPSKFTRTQLLATSHVLVEWPDPDDGDPSVSGATRLRRELASGFTLMACEGRWCLYASPSSRAQRAAAEKRVTAAKEAIEEKQARR